MLPVCETVTPAFRGHGRLLVARAGKMTMRQKKWAGEVVPGSLRQKYPGISLEVAGQDNH